VPGSVARAAAPPKAVIIVGPVGSVQSSYLADGAHIADVAASYGMDVRRVFHPHATWANVLANIQGASIVVYLGHGNGWPSPYAPFQTTTKDGFGLNASDGSSTVKYYGEGPIAAAVHLAPNAVVILNHACYTTGASEPGMAPPTPAVAMQRVDNFGAGFLRVGARAVFAFGGQDPASVIRDLMTTHRTIDGIFTGSGYNGGWDIRFPSLRTPGYDVHLDPAGSSTYYRSVVGDLGMTADDVTGAPFADTGVAPAAIVVPGNATVATTADVLAAPGGSIVRSLDAGTPVRVTSGPVAGLGAGAYYGISSPAAGYVAADRLSPADSTGPRMTDMEPAVLAFSPDGDGTNDSLPVTISWSEDARWTARLDRLDGTRLAGWSGSGPTASFTWDGTYGGATLPDGRYRLSAWATDAAGNPGTTLSRVVVIDTAAPTFALAGTAAGALSVDAAPVFTPNGDGSGDVLGIGVTASEPTVIDLVVRDGSSAVVRHARLMVQAGASTVSWDGRGDDGTYVPDGDYALELVSRDPAANAGATFTTYGRVLTALRSVTVSRSIFYSADADSLAPSSTISFTAVRPVTIDWTIIGPSGAVAVSHWTARATTPGTYTWTWRGKNAAGAYLPSGAYTSIISATTADGTVVYRKAIWVGPFKMTPSTPTLAVGRSVSVTILSAESLSRRPTLTVTQPGLAPYVLSTTWISTRTYRVTFTPRAGATGAVTLKAYGVDIYGHAQRAYLSVPLP
jgi:flagellar hook assembly protein FlgD